MNPSGNTETIHDAIIVGAGPGGLQAAIYLARYNRDIVLVDRGGGRTGHALHVENVLGHPLTTGREIIETGLAQVRAFGVPVRTASVRRIRKTGGLFRIETDGDTLAGRYVVAATGARDNLLQVRHLSRFFARSVFTCIDCDGYRTTGKKLLLVGNSFHTVRLAFAMKEMFTPDITLLLIFYEPPPDVREALHDEGIRFVKGRPAALVGDEQLEALELDDGRRLPCEVVMSDFGYKLNDDFLEGLELKKDAQNFKYVTSRVYESSLRGLYLVGPLTTNDQIIISAAGGAIAAIDIKKHLLEI